MFDKIKDVINEKLILKLNDAHALAQLQPLSDFYAPWGSSSLNPSSVVLVLNDIVINKRNCIVECGSGISTFFIANLLKNSKHENKKFYSIEHDEGWMKVVENELRNNGLESYVEMVYAPLNDFSLSWNKDSPWYDNEKLNDKFSKGDIDLLLIDGPPAYQKEKNFSRYPAIPFFNKYLAKDYTIFLDDINREAEQIIIKEWENILGKSFRNYKSKGNIGVCSSGKSFTI